VNTDVPGRTDSLQFVLKATARCNLNCSYCYVFNKADQSWRTRSRVMSDDVFVATMRRIRRHCEASRQPIVRVMFHGGEPLLAGVARFRRWLTMLHAELDGVARISLAVQTNAVLVDDRWAALFEEFDVEVGISLDGPKEVNDRFRVDHVGRGSYDAIVAAMDVLRARGVRFSILSVIQFGADGLDTYRHFRSLQPGTINFLFPDQTHADIAAVRAEHGPHPVADFLLPVIDEWCRVGADGPDVPLVRNIARIVLGGETRSDMFGNPPLGFVFVETDGEIEGLDVLRVDGQGLASTGLDVHRNDFVEIDAVSPFHAQAIFDGVPLPAGCRGCPEEQTCAGGYLPHRWSPTRGFDNPSAWCADILLLFARVRERFGVDAHETGLRQTVLREMVAATS